MITNVRLSARAVKDVRKVPRHVEVNLLAWVEAVATHGLEQVRKVPGYHDEPLKGERKGQRSIRLTRAYRAIYVIERDHVRGGVRADQRSHEAQVLIAAGHPVEEGILQ